MIHEVYVFLSAMASGLTAGFLYDIIRMKRKALKTKMAMAAFEDIAFWIITSILIFVTAYVSNQGEIRMYFSSLCLSELCSIMHSCHDG